LDENTNNLTHILSTLLESLSIDLPFSTTMAPRSYFTLETVLKMEKTLMIVLNYRFKVTTPSEYIKELLVWLCPDYDSVKEIIDRAEELAYLSLI
jgi:hypothetical protein